MMNGYSVTEAASVLGVPTERVWELLARGVLSGAPEGDTGMRVFLQPRPAPAPVTAIPVDDPVSPRANGPERELSPFRELLTEFRNLTERYGQALLALGEARGEVASLRSRVDLLEARIDLRLPMGPPSAAPWPTQPLPVTEPVAGAGSRPEGAVEHEDEEAHRRPRRGARRATESFAEALARAEDPSPADLPGGSDPSHGRAGTEDIDRSLPREVMPAEPVLVADEAAEEPVAPEATVAEREPMPAEAEPAAEDLEAVSRDSAPDTGWGIESSDGPAEAEPEPEPTAILPEATVEVEPTPVEPLAEFAAAAPEAEPEATVEVDSTPAEPEAESEAQVEAEPEATLEVEPTPVEPLPDFAAAEPEAESEVRAESEPEAEAELQVEPEPQADVALEAHAELEPDAERFAEGQAEAEEPSAEAEPGDFDAERYTTAIEQPDWFEAEVDDAWTPMTPPDETIADIEETRPAAVAPPMDEPGASQAPAEAWPAEAAEVEEAVAEGPSDEAADAGGEQTDWSGPESGETGADEMEMAGGGQGPSGQPEEAGETELPGTRELDEALEAFGGLGQRPVTPPMAEDEWPPVTRREEPGSQMTPRPSGFVARQPYAPPIPGSPATRAYRRLRRIFPT